MHKPNFIRKSRADDAGSLAFAKDLLCEYRRSKLLLRSIRNVTRSHALPGEARAIANKLVFSQALPASELEALRSDSMRELFAILAFGAENGNDVEEALDLFTKRLEVETSLKNRLKVKMGGAQALTYMGMSVFFPLFSSISAVIFNSSLGFFGTGAAVSSSFELACAAYVPLILCISASFAHPERPFAENALSVAPYAAVAFFVMVFVPNVLLHVL